MPLTDEDAAIEAVASLASFSSEQQEAQRAVNTILQNGEPFVDVHELFNLYDTLYFRKLLHQRVEVLWSPRLTLCAGICELSKDPSTGKFTRIRLKLSTPLLQYRPRSDTINTLLHEAIHAYFFVTTSWRHSRGDDGTGHGAGFLLLADAINNHGNYEVTVFHTFHDEVDSYRTHVWQCNGPCRERAPFFGIVKRSMNRPPSKSDNWWAAHEAECGGSYTKIQEPELTKKQRDALSKKERAGLQKNKLDNWVKVGGKDSDATRDSSSRRAAVSASGTKAADAKRKAQTITSDDVIESSISKRAKSSPEGAHGGESEDSVISKASGGLVECPICTAQMTESDINEHLDLVHCP